MGKIWVCTPTKIMKDLNIAKPLVECEVLNGLKPLAIQEIKKKFGNQASLIPQKNPALIIFQYAGSIQELLSLRTAAAVYLLSHYEIPRPRALLGHQHLTRLVAEIEKVLALHPPNTFETFTISAAGSDSSTFQKIREVVSKATNLTFSPDEADLLLRVRPSAADSEGWDVLTRISPRPLSTRKWRTYNMEGALNATVAAGIVELAQPKPQDKFLNLMSGSGTLLIERLLRSECQLSIGADINLGHLLGAQRNINNSGVHPNGLVQMDVSRTAFPSNCFDVICADLPWGQLVGSDEENRILYPKILGETARIAASNACFILLTHSIKLMEKVIREGSHLWQLEAEIKIVQGGLHPRIYILRKV